MIPGDRDLRTTLQRYQRKTRYLTYKNAGKMHKPGNPLHIESEANYYSSVALHVKNDMA